MLGKYLNDLKFEMKRKGIAREEVAKAVGVSLSTINNVLRGANGTLATLKKISDYIYNK